MMRLALSLMAVALLAGCAFLHSKTQTEQDGEVTTVVTSYTLWDSQAALARFQNRGVVTHSNEWAPGTTIGSLNQSSSSTNVNDLIGTVVGAAIKAGVKP